MAEFHRNQLEMKITQSWDEPSNRGALLSFRGKVSSTVIEVIELGDEALPGIKPINVVLSSEVTALVLPGYE